MRYKTRTTAYYEQDGHTLPLPFTGEFYREHLHVSADGLTAVLGVLCQDDDPEDPFNGDEGEFYQFNHRSIHYTERPDVDKFKRIIRANPGRVFTHDGTENCHGPGTVACHVTAGPFTVADTKGSTPRTDPCEAEHALDHSAGYYIVPEDVTDPARYAAGALQSYSSWCNGEVYAVCVWTYHRETDGDDWQLDKDSRQECWGFIGSKYAEEELDSQFTAATQGPVQ